MNKLRVHITPGGASVAEARAPRASDLAHSWLPSAVALWLPQEQRILTTSVGVLSAAILAWRMICPAGTQRESGSNSTGGNKEMSAHRPWRCWRSPSATLRGLGMSLPRSNRGNEGPSTWASAHTLLCFHRRWVVGVGTETTCANLPSLRRAGGAPRGG